MYTSRNNVIPVFQMPPCEDNGWITYSEELGRLVAYPEPGGSQGLADIKNGMLEEYDQSIKKQYGPEHFHGEEGMPIMAALRNVLEI